jgi:hypothetical protein
LSARNADPSGRWQACDRTGAVRLQQVSRFTRLPQPLQPRAGVNRDGQTIRNRGGSDLSTLVERLHGGGSTLQ